MFRNVVKNAHKTFKIELLLIWYLNKLFGTSRCQTESMCNKLKDVHDVNSKHLCDFVAEEYLLNRNN